MKLTTHLVPKAGQYLNKVCPGRTGKGAFISALILMEQAREQAKEEQQAREPRSTKASWRATGVTVA